MSATDPWRRVLATRLLHADLVPRGRIDRAAVTESIGLDGDLGGALGARFERKRLSARPGSGPGRVGCVQAAALTVTFGKSMSMRPALPSRLVKMFMPTWVMTSTMSDSL